MAALTDEVIKNLIPEQKQNLEELYGLLMEEGRVDEKAIKLFNKGFRYEPHGDGLAISICEDWDDLAVQNMFKPPEEQHPIYREKIERREQIKETLKKSLNLGLGYLGLIQRQCKNYRVEV